MDPGLALLGLGVGFVVGMTGFGGGALMTPLLVLLFRLDPLAAVGTDLVAALGMKPVGAAVHMRRGTVHANLVLWLSAGAVPAALAGVLLLRVIGPGRADDLLREMLGVALLASAVAMLVRPLLEHASPQPFASRRIRPVIPIALGAVGGFLVGITSVGSGSVMIVMLLVAYPGLRTTELVGTDLALSVPLLATAAAGHLLFGDVRLAMAGSLLVGALPGVYAGARLSSRAPDAVLRPVLFVMLLSTGAKLVNLV